MTSNNPYFVEFENLLEAERLWLLELDLIDPFNFLPDDLIKLANNCPNIEYKNWLMQQKIFQAATACCG